MPSEIHLAFSHPSERAAATAGATPLDRISVRDHVVEVEIGAFQAKRGVTQRICFNIVVEVQPLADALDDDVDRILSYDKVTEAITFALAEELRDALPGACFESNLGGGSFKAQMKRADRSGAAYALILGEQELNEGRIGLKPLRTDDEQESIALDDLVAVLQDKLSGQVPQQ